MTRIAALAFAAFALPAAALAQDAPRIVGSGENASVVHAPGAGNVVGGATWRVIGAGESGVIEVIEVQAVQPPAQARVVGSGENLSVVLSPPSAPRG